MQKYKIRYGANMTVREFESGITIGELKRDPQLRANLGYGDNVNAIYRGATLPDTAEAPSFDENANEGGSLYAGAIVFETACNAKA